VLTPLAVKVEQFKVIKNWPTSCLLFGVYSGKLVFNFLQLVVLFCVCPNTAFNKDNTPNDDGVFFNNFDNIAQA
jgi:hypothetical protein